MAVKRSFYGHAVLVVTALASTQMAAQAQDTVSSQSVPAAIRACTVNCGGAQQSGPDGAFTTYQPDFFASYNPVTALDMVRQVPGFSIDNGDNSRGFGGAAGNVLINGERPSTKSNSLQSILSRIAVSRVERVDLIRGSTAGIDMRGLSRVVNVVLCDCDEGGQTTIVARLNHAGRRVFFNGELIYAVRLLGSDFTFSLERNTSSRRESGVEQTFDPLVNLLENRDETDQRWFREWQPTFNMEKNFANGDALRLNGKYFNWEWNRNEISTIRSSVNDVLRPDGFDFNTSDNDGNGYEVGGDFEKKLSESQSVKLIFVKNRTEENFLDDFEGFTGQGFESASRADGGSVENETILRLLHDWSLNEQHTVQFGVEGALNSLNSRLDLFEDTGNGLEQIVLDVSNTRVNEDRGEFFGSWVYRPISELTFETGLKYEISTIAQSGDASLARTFKFWKPSLTATWDVSSKNQIRTSIEREVAQLNFSDFVSNIDFSSEQTDLGNPELEPDRTWSSSITWEHRFASKGSLNVTYQRDRITQVQGLVPINNEFDAVGNLGNGKRQFIEIETRLPLDRLGLKNATLDGTLFLQKSSVIDPVTGARRRLGGEPKRGWGLDFRQDINALNIAWGWDYNSGRGSRSFRLFEERFNNNRSGDLDAFIETTRFGGMTIRAGVDNIFNQKRQRTRTFFDGSRALGIIDSIEQRSRANGLLYSLSIRGTF